MNENKNEYGKNIKSKSLNIPNIKLPKMKENSTLFKALNPSKIKISNNNNEIQNFFSSKKLNINLKIQPKEKNKNENIIKRAESERNINLKKQITKKKNLVDTLNSFKKKNYKKKEEKDIKQDPEEEEEELKERKKYSKKLIDHLNNKLFAKIITTDLLRRIKDKELIEQDFEKEVRNYQLLNIIELNNRIREGEAIKSVHDIKDLYDKNNNSNIYNNYFQIKEKEKKEKDLGIKGIKIKNININEINKEIKEKEEEIKEKELYENNNINKDFNKKKYKEERNYIKYLDLKFGKQKKEKKKKINNILIKENDIEIGLNDFHSLSQVGINKEGINKINQEALLELINILGNPKFNIFGIFSGHGKNGHIISRYISRYIKEYFLFSDNKLILKKCKSNKELYNLFSKNNYEYIKQLMYECEYKLQNSQFDCDYSGVSCLLIIIIENHLICSNIGNCRAIILEKNDLFQLTFDQSISIPEERKRIEKKGGIIKWSIEKGLFNNENYKILLKDKNNKMHYIETSRSLGDKMFKKIGVEFSPVISEYLINIETKFVVMATKGLWNILTNKQVAYYVNKGYKISNPLESCRKLIQKANDIYEKFMDSRDDISLFTLFF